VIADRFAEVTVLFADLVDFTRSSDQSSPERVVKVLNDLFTAFDRLARRHGLEKIKTIGDAYMVAGGLPEPRPDHAQAVAEMALAMREEASRHADPAGQPLQVRIGIDTGPVVAGVIGTTKFSYDLWGDTVNTASRMESHGVEGCIQVTERTYRRLKDRYRFQRRGPIQVKGKGTLVTYLLLGGPPGGDAAARSIPFKTAAPPLPNLAEGEFPLGKEER
jgi:adenylate cyclase